ncbi:protein neprosin [Cicer arietinum]|uniref:Uncharacterized protein LOC101488774 isoform X2 n=1 Tax=Cicer arietinum TaxID=3827 RepID=A0A1S3E9N8_CICAR|nr:uncharacterized protein LOC101488774 isoform X2 [Cicer arietinum]
MALFLVLVVSLCISCCRVGGYVSDIIVHQVDNDFDCVDMYKQPTLQHPLLKNHKIQLNPTFTRNTVQRRSSSFINKVIGGCPIGKVPIYKKRVRHQNIINASSKLQTEDFHQDYEHYNSDHFATLDTTQSTTFHGASAIIGLYNLSLQGNQFSLSSIRIESGPPTEINIIQIGVGVHPKLYGDSQLRITALWTVDSYYKTRCYNYECQGFVQVNQNKSYTLGNVISPSNSIGSTEKYALGVKIKQDPSTGHWWLFLDRDEIQVGYWPKELFNHLSIGASLIRFGGETYAPPNIDNPSMGSGRLPQEGFKNSSFMGRLEIIDSKYSEISVNPEHMKKYSDANSNCYDLLYHGYEGVVYRQAFLYGGPGGLSGQCDI